MFVTIFLMCNVLYSDCSMFDKCRKTNIILGVILGVVVVIFIIVVCVGVQYTRSKYFECSETNTIVGRAEYMDMLRENGVVIGRGPRAVATVACAPDNIVKYHSRKSVEDILDVHKKAEERGIDDALAKVVANGQRFIVYERCQPVTSENLPSNWREHFAEIKSLKSIGLRDIHIQNIMVCRDRLVMVDQDPDSPVESAIFSIVNFFGKADMTLADKVKRHLEKLEQSS